MTTKEKGAKPAPKKPAKKPVAKKKATGSTARTRKPGRPSSFTEAIGIALCAAIAEGMSLRKACALPGMPDVSTVIRWLADEERAEFCAQYARAREAQADVLAEEILSIADEECTMILASKHGSHDDDGEGHTEVVFDSTAVARNRLRVDARKWLASKMAPKKYGDKITAEHTGANGGAIQVASTVTFVRPPARAEDE
ncbi:MAG TPA: hypothetical protein DEO91_17710 [Pseudomonas sp.]|nr:hypothetical protein [Pseudomonas sp.]